MNRNRETWKVAILGGGITGLSAAFYLMRAAKEQGLPVEATLLEGSDRLGGRIDTLRREDGFVIERGPESFLARKLAMIDLIRDVGLEGELTGTNPRLKQTFIVRGGRLYPMPAGLHLGIPSDIGPFLRSRLITPAGRLRALADLWLPRRRGGGDESLGALLARRFGREVVDRIAEPLLAGIYAGDLNGLSMQATFPQFGEMERKHGSLIRGTQAARRAAQQAAAEREKAGVKQTEVERATRQWGSVFLTLRRGLSTLVEELEARLRAEGCVIRLNARAVSLRRPAGEAGASSAPYAIGLEDGGTVAADAVLLALPAYAIAELLRPHVDVGALEAIRYVSVANVALGYSASGFGAELNGSGFVVPRSEGRRITASTWTSAKWPHTAPDNKRLIRCYVGRAGDESGVLLPDDALVYEVRRDLREIMGLEAKPFFAEITRLHRSMPQYPVGHAAGIAAFRQELARRLPGVHAAGAPFGGVGLPDCVAQGKEAAGWLLPPRRP